MKKNIGKKDRLFRLTVAMLLLTLAYWQSSWIALLCSLFVFYEAIAGWCVVYQMLGKSSCKIDK